MSRRPAVAALAIAAVVLTLAPWPGATPIASASGALKPAPTHLLVYAQEWSLWPSRGTVPAGTVRIELWNRGQDMHDLRIRHVNHQGQMLGPIDGAVSATPSGGISYATWHLQRGRYMIYCSMPGHLQRGMHARIDVTR